MDPIVKQYVDLVCGYTNIPYKIICTKSRKREIREARQILIYILHYYNKTPKRRAGFVVLKDHATALHSIRAVENDLNTNDTFRNKYSTLFHMAELLKTTIEIEQKGGKQLREGDLCWFWKDGDEVPTLRRFEGIDKSGKVAYAKGSFSPFTHWESFDQLTLPEEFRRIHIKEPQKSPAL
jgi:hypothetical protein